MNRPAKIRPSSKQNAVLKDAADGTQKADDQMEFDPSGQMERVGTETKPTLIQTVAFYTELGTKYGTALVNQDTGQVFLSLEGVIEGAEFHYNVSHSPQQVAHATNYKLIPDAVVAMLKLWPILKARVPEALKGQSPDAIQQQAAYIGQLVEVGTRVTSFATGVENRQAVAENGLVSSLRQIYDVAAPIINGDTILMEKAEPLYNLFFKGAVTAVAQKKAFEKVAADATAKAQEQQPQQPEAPPSATPPPHGTVGVPVTVPPPTLVPPKANAPATARSAGKGKTKKKP